MAGLTFLAVRDPDGVNDKDIGKSILKALAQGHHFYVARVPELIDAYEFYFWSQDEIAALLKESRKGKEGSDTMNDTIIFTTEEKT